MSAALVNKLLESFNELDRCIKLTQDVLAQKRGVPSEVLNRVAQYSSIVEKQRSLAGELKDFITAQNWEEVARHVRLINGLSAMIRDDAQSILCGAVDRPSPEKGDQLLS